MSPLPYMSVWSSASMVGLVRFCSHSWFSHEVYESCGCGCGCGGGMGVGVGEGVEVGFMCCEEYIGQW